jgi:M6 family metalloprotease-like protein
LALNGDDGFRPRRLQWHFWDLFSTSTTSGNQVTTKDGSTYGAPSVSYTSGTNYSAKATSYKAEDEAESAEGFMMPSTGKVNILVIPVIIDDFSSNATEGVRSSISKAFFGDPSDTSWESLASYYYKSSYGQLLLNGTVAPWYESGYTSSELSKLTYSGTSSYASGYQPTWTVLENAVSWYAKKYNTNLSEFDSNKDGVIDAVWLVYSAPDYSNDTALDSTDFWAYTYSDLLPYEKAVKAGGEVSTDIPFRYSWASFDFLYAGYEKSGIDAHTYIHETGHLMGLDDYYVSDTTESYPTNYGPMGRIDMMDYNIIDHDAYSKFALGWIKPYVVTGDATITLEPSATTGQAILLPTSDGWNGNYFDEYILMEFYTPSLLNEKDSASAYADNGAQGFTEDGVRIYHVDARLVKISGKTVTYSDKIVSDDSTGAYTMAAHSNSGSYNASMGTPVAFRLIQEMDCTKKRNFDTEYEPYTKNGKSYKLPCTADNSTLFQAGDSFSFSSYASSFPKTTMNNGTTFGYTVSFASMSSKSITATISAA